MNRFIEVNNNLRKEREGFLAKEKQRKESNALYVDAVVKQISSSAKDICSAIRDLGYTPTHRDTTNLNDDLAFYITASKFELPGDTSPIRNAKFVVWRNRDEGEVSIIAGSLSEVDKQLKNKDFAKYKAEEIISKGEDGIRTLLDSSYYSVAKALLD